MNTPDIEELVEFRLNKADELIKSHVSPKDYVPIKMAIEKISNPEITNENLYDKYYNKPKPKAQKRALVTAKTTRVINKYPDIFKPLRDKALVDMEQIMKSFNDIALDPDHKVADRIKAGKVLIDSAVQVEKMSKDKQIQHLSMETVVADGKSFKDIIGEVRQKLSA